MAKEKSLYEEFLELRQGNVDEKSVEPVYRNHIMKWLQDNTMWFRNVDTIFTDTIKGSKTDGYLKGSVITQEKDEKPFCFLLEVKKGNKFDTEEGRILGLCQVIHYLHDLSVKGIDIPTVALIGDLYNCFCFSTKHFIDKYIESNKYNWDCKPSAAFDKKDGKLFEDLRDDADAQKVYGTVDKIEQGFSVRNTIIPKIRGYVLASEYKNPITEKNMLRVFNLFADEVLDEKELNARQKVAIFMSLLTGSVRDYANSRELDCQKIKGVEKIVKVNPSSWISFKFNYDWDIEGSVLEKIIACSDALIDTEDRKRKGDYYTPDIWRNKALGLMDENIVDDTGKAIDWYNEFIVWDCCSGPKILTSSETFRHLYCSTLYGNELKLLGNYCDNDFQYDFLRDDVKKFEELLTLKQNGNELTKEDFDKVCIPDSLLNELLSRKRPLLFFVNPPYASDKNGGSDTKSKAKTTDTLIKEQMNRAYNLGKASNELYVQFLYRMLKIAELFDIPLYIGVFSKTSFLASDSFKNFRSDFLSKMKYLDSFYIYGKEFSGVKGEFGIMFSLWKSDKDGTINKNEFETTVYRKVEKDYAEEKKIVYNLDGKETLRNFTNCDESKIKIDAPQLSNALEYYNEHKRGYLIPNALGYLVFNANNVEQGIKMAFFLSSCASGANGFSVTPKNFLKCTSGFMARKLGSNKSNWVNSKDEFLVPNEEHEEYQQWVNDSIIYSLFNTQSQQSSLKNVKYNGKKPIEEVRCVSYNEYEDTYRIKNEFFFMSRQEILNLADKYYSEMYQSMKSAMRRGKDRFVYTLLNGNGINEDLQIENFTLSPDAIEILDLAKEIVTDTFKYRKVFTEKSGEGEKYQVYNWDAGWNQIFGVDDKTGGRTGLVGWVLKNYEEELIKMDGDKILNPDCLQAKVEKFLSLYGAFEDKRRDLVKELGFLK